MRSIVPPWNGTVVLFVALAAAWGSSFVAIRAGLEQFPPVLFAALRFELAALFVFGYAAVRADRWVPTGRVEWLHVLASGLFVYGAYHALLFVGQQYVSSATAAILVCTAPVLTIGFARVLLTDERLATAGVLGVLLSLIGVWFVARPAAGSAVGGSRGELLVLAAASATALGSVLVQRYPVTLPLASRQAWAMGLGAVVLQALSLARGESFSAIHWTPEAVGVLVYLVVVPSVAGFLAYFTLLERVGSIETNLVEYATPVFAALLGWLVLGETIGTSALVGFCLIAAGFLVVKRETLRARLPRLLGAVP